MIVSKFISVILFLTFITTHTYAKVASIRFVNGSAVLYRGSKELKVVKNLDVLEGDIITTKNKSFVMIKFPGTTSIKIDPNTSFEVQKFIEEYQLKINHGGAIFKVQKQKSQLFKVFTKTASMGVRGTIFYVNQSMENSNSWACVKEGSIEVSKNDSDLKQIVTQGLGVSIDKTISKPAQLEWTKGINWSFEEEQGNINEVKISNYNILDFDYD